MRRKLSPWGWATAGAVSVLVAVWLGTTVYTVVKQSTDENRITHIEEVVVGVGGAKALRAHQSVPASGPGGGGALHTGPTGHRQSGPSTGGHGNSGGVGSGGHGGGHSPGHNPGSKSPAPTPAANPAPVARDTGADISTHTTPAEEHADNPLPEAVEATGKAAGEAVEKTGDAAQGAVEGVGKVGEGATCGSLLAPGC